MNKDEQYWHNKHPRVIQEYRGRPLPNGTMYVMDVRHFIWHDDYRLQEEAMTVCHDQNPDTCAHEVQKYVVQRLKYVSDDTLGHPEYFLFPAETLAMSQGDCEDGAILIASMLLSTIQPEDYWRVRVACGFVRPEPTAPLGGHGYCCYCRRTDNEWVALDWCYLEDSEHAVAQKDLIRVRAEYEGVWFSFNHLHAWSHNQQVFEGRTRSGQ